MFGRRKSGFKLGHYLIAAAPLLLAEIRNIESIATEALTDGEIQKRLKIKGIITIARTLLHLPTP